MSEFLGQILGGLSGAGATAAGLGSMLAQLLGAAEGANGGGVPGLIAQFESAGLGTQIRSWVGRGENLPVTAEQIAAAIPPEQLAHWSAKLGVPEEELAAMLADILPNAIDHVTPTGEVPPAG